MIRWRAMSARAVQALARVDLAIDVSQPLSACSIAVQQMIAIARALDVSAKLLVLDEPTSSLDEKEVAELFKVIRKLRDEGLGIIIVTHFLNQVYAISDRITVLRDGRLVTTVVPAESSPRAVAHLMVGREIESASHFGARVPGAAMLEARGVTLPWPGHAQKYRLRDVNLTVHAGEVLAPFENVSRFRLLPLEPIE